MFFGVARVGNQGEATEDKEKENDKAGGEVDVFEKDRDEGTDGLVAGFLGDALTAEFEALTNVDCSKMSHWKYYTSPAGSYNPKIL